jgi:hypothetical protein
MLQDILFLIWLILFLDHSLVHFNGSFPFFLNLTTTSFNCCLVFLSDILDSFGNSFNSSLSAWLWLYLFLVFADVIIHLTVVDILAFYAFGISLLFALLFALSSQIFLFTFS